MSVAARKMQHAATAHGAARRMAGGGRPAVKQSGALEPINKGAPSRSSGLTISASRLKGSADDRLPPIVEPKLPGK